MSTCGCKQCGGPQARADALLARRVVAHANYIQHVRGEALGTRRVRPGLYERLLMGRQEGATA